MAFEHVFQSRQWRAFLRRKDVGWKEEKTVCEFCIDIDDAGNFKTGDKHRQGWTGVEGRGSDGCIADARQIQHRWAKT